MKIRLLISVLVVFGLTKCSGQFIPQSLGGSPSHKSIVQGVIGGKLGVVIPTYPDTATANLNARVRNEDGIVIKVNDYLLMRHTLSSSWKNVGRWRFGIEDNISLAERNINMNGHRFILDKTTALFLRSINLGGQRFTNLYIDTTNFNVYNIDPDSQNQIEVNTEKVVLSSKNLNTGWESTFNLTSDSMFFKQDSANVEFIVSIPKRSSTLNGLKYVPLSVQLNGTEVFSDLAGKINLGTITFPTITTSNGLNRVGDDIRLGGTLTSSSTIINTNSRQIVLTNSGSTGQPLSVIGTNAGAASFSATTGPAISAYSTGATSINGTSEGNNFAANFRSWSTGSSSPVNVLKLEALSTVATVSNGFGSRLEFQNQTNSPNIQVSNVLNSVWTNAANASRTSEFSITGISNTLTNTLLTLSGSGSTRLNKYGIGTFTGFATHDLAVNSSGDIIEVSTARGTTETASNGLTKVVNDIQLGGNLTSNRTINAASNIFKITGAPPVGQFDGLIQFEGNGGGTSNPTVKITNSAAVSSSALSVDNNSGGGGGITGFGTAYGISGSGNIGGDFSGFLTTSPTIRGTNNTLATSTAIPMLELNYTPVGQTIGNGVSIDFKASSNTVGNRLLSQIISKWTNATDASRSSDFSIMGVNNTTTQTYANFQTGGIVRVNNLADTLATKAYARSVGGGGGGGSDPLKRDIADTVVAGGTASNYDLAIATLNSPKWDSAFKRVWYSVLGDTVFRERVNGSVEYTATVVNFILTTTGSGAATWTPLTNTLNIPVSSGYDYRLYKDTVGLVPKQFDSSIIINMRRGAPGLVFHDKVNGNTAYIGLSTPIGGAQDLNISSTGGRIVMTDAYAVRLPSIVETPSGLGLNMSGNSFDVDAAADIRLRTNVGNINIVHGGYNKASEINSYTGYPLLLNPGGADNGNGNVLIGSNSNDGVNKLQVAGGIKAAGFMLSALNTAPTSSTDFGTTGEIRYDANYMYVCVATNTWKRSALITW